mmetsp:Transcript_14749/g.41764  ORF Transcript_14749/g.41764 Transcript_14749/m.41764 type:complete len:207 (+) Transcript_14749:2918-3538(+)
MVSLARRRSSLEGGPQTPYSTSSSEPRTSGSFSSTSDIFARFRLVSSSSWNFSRRFEVYPNVVLAIAWLSGPTASPEFWNPTRCLEKLVPSNLWLESSLPGFLDALAGSSTCGPCTGCIANDGSSGSWRTISSPMCFLLVMMDTDGAALRALRSTRDITVDLVVVADAAFLAATPELSSLASESYAPTKSIFCDYSLMIVLWVQWR